MVVVVAVFWQAFRSSHKFKLKTLEIVVFSCCKSSLLGVCVNGFYSVRLRFGSFFPLSICAVTSIDVFPRLSTHTMDWWVCVHKLKHNSWARTTHNFWLKSTMRCEAKCIGQAGRQASEQSSESTIAHSVRCFELYARTFLDTYTYKSNVLNSLANRVRPPDPVKISRPRLPSPKSKSERTNERWRRRRREKYCAHLIYALTVPLALENRTANTKCVSVRGFSRFLKLENIRFGC